MKTGLKDTEKGRKSDSRIQASACNWFVDQSKMPQKWSLKENS